MMEKKKENRIEFFNRWGTEVYLEKDESEDNLFCLKGEISPLRLIGKEWDKVIDTGDIGGVDPPGGPFILKGDLIPGTDLIAEKIFEVDNEIKISVHKK